MIGSEVTNFTSIPALTNFAAMPAATCTASIDRMIAGQSLSIDSADFDTNLDSSGKFQDPTFPADTSSLYLPFQHSEK
jgi:hypothetical protein